MLHCIWLFFRSIYLDKTNGEILGEIPSGIVVLKALVNLVFMPYTILTEIGVLKNKVNPEINLVFTIQGKICIARGGITTKLPKFLCKILPIVQ